MTVEYNQAVADEMFRSPAGDAAREVMPRIGNDLCARMRALCPVGPTGYTIAHIHWELHSDPVTGDLMLKAGTDTSVGIFLERGSHHTGPPRKFLTGALESMRGSTY